MVDGWDYAEEFIWPNTDTLSLIGNGNLGYIQLHRVTLEIKTLDD